MKRDLIDRHALLSRLNGYPEARGIVADQPAITPQVVANISGGVLQGASANYPVDIYTLDFDDVPYDNDEHVIEVEGSEAELGQCAALVDPDFVRHVINAPTRADLENACDRCGDDASGGDGYMGLCGNCADREEGDE